MVSLKEDIVRVRKMGTNEEFENIIPSNILHNQEATMECGSSKGKKVEIWSPP